MDRDEARRRQDDNIKNMPKSIYELDPTSAEEYQISDF